MFTNKHHYICVYTKKKTVCLSDYSSDYSELNKKKKTYNEMDFRYFCNKNISKTEDIFRKKASVLYKNTYINKDEGNIGKIII